MKKFLSFIATFATSMLPVAAFAQGNFTNAESALGTVIRIINVYIIPLIIGIAVIAFMYGLIKYVTSGGDEGARTEARNTIITGIVVIVVMISVYGLVRFVINTFGLESLNQSGPGALPQIPTVRQ